MATLTLDRRTDTNGLDGLDAPELEVLIDAALDRLELEDDPDRLALLRRGHRHLERELADRIAQ